MTEQRSITYVEIDVDYCSLTYSVAPCQATLTGSPPTGTRKCFNTKNTCQDLANFTNVPVTLRFAVDANYLPIDVDCIPNIKSIDFTPATISLGSNLGQRATLKVTFRDHPHSDTGAGGDKYLADRDYDPFEQGTFWGKFRARQPFLRGRPLRLIRGLLGTALEDMDTRHYIMESADGPTLDGEFIIVAKDVLKLADEDRAQAPLLSSGVLLASITNTDLTATLSPAGVGDAEYSPSGYINLGGKEIVGFTRGTTDGDILTLTRAQLNTTAVAHDADERAQEVVRYESEDPADIIYDLLVGYAGVDASLIPLTDWQTETGTFVNRVYTGTIVDPTSVNELIAELCEQVGLAIWWDDQAQHINLQVLRALVAVDTFDENNILENTLEVTEQPESRVSRVWTYYGLINPLEKLDTLENYQSSVETVDVTSEENYGTPAIKKVLSRWIPANGLSAAQSLNNTFIARFQDPPRRFNFDVFRYVGQAPILGGGYYLSSWPFQDDTGAQEQLSIQITRLKTEADHFEIEAEEMLFTSGAPDSPDFERVIVFDTDQNNVNLRTVHDTLFTAPVSGNVVRAIVQSGVVIGSTSNATSAFDLGTWPAGVDITLQLDGRVEGKGGNGGSGGVAGSASPGTSGQTGGVALYLRRALDVEYGASAAIWGGGGGGGGGGSSFFGGAIGGGGGGGGAGRLGGTGGSNGGGPANSGTAGTDTAGGSGGSSAIGANGGTGGNPGASGSSGIAGNLSAGGSGGSAGAAIDGDSNINVVSGSADIQGSQIN